MGSSPKITYFLSLVKSMAAEGAERVFQGWRHLPPPPASMSPTRRSRGGAKTRYLGKHSDFAGVLIHCLDGALEHSRANHLPCNLSPPINDSHSLITDGEVNDRLGLGATFRHYLQFKHTSARPKLGQESHPGS